MEEIIAGHKRVLFEEGFKHIFEWKDEPGYEYVLHAHKDKVSFFVVEGSITFTYTDGEIVELAAGDRIDVVPGREHVARVGVNGCQYVVGEMIEGDS